MLRRDGPTSSACPRRQVVNHSLAFLSLGMLLVLLKVFSSAADSADHHKKQWCRPDGLTRSYVAHCGSCHNRRCMAQRGPLAAHRGGHSQLGELRLRPTIIACPQWPHRVHPHACRLAHGCCPAHRRQCDAMRCNAMRCDAMPYQAMPCIACVAVEPSLPPAKQNVWYG
jgi:hypothetical protein